MRYLSIGLAMEGKGCLIIGGGAIALEKVQVVAPSRARMTVVSPDFIEGFAALPDLELIRRQFEPADLDGMTIGIAATDDPAVNAEFYRQCRCRGVLCNAVDDVQWCDFIVPSMLRRGPLVVSVLSSGAAPALSKRLRQTLEELFPEDFGDYVTFLGEARDLAKRILTDASKRHDLATFLASPQGQKAFTDMTVAQRKVWLDKLIDEARCVGQDGEP
jgi:precorrin-2 dehydrogenase/sirohydrochlorin ferrochelatase